MLLHVLKAKIHEATVTEANLNYHGSITIDSQLLKRSGIRPSEMVHVFNITQGTRFQTYVIPGGWLEVAVNGAAAHLVEKGDKIIIIASAWMEEKEASQYRPPVLFLNEKNGVKEQISYDPCSPIK